MKFTCGMWFICLMLGEKVVQGLYDYAAADQEMAGQDLNFKKGDYMVVVSKYVSYLACGKRIVRILSIMVVVYGWKKVL